MCSYNGYREEDDYITVEGEFVTETDAAIMLKGDDIDPEDSWFPKSQILDWDDGIAVEGDYVQIEIKEWLAKAKGII